MAELYVQAYINGGMTAFEVIQHGDFFEIAHDGKIVATMKHQNGWQQVSGDRLPEEVIESIGQQIHKPLA
jgi:hypothetical protein